LSLPRIVEAFAEGGFEFIVEDAPEGAPLLAEWSRADWPQRCDWLVQIAEALDRLHCTGAILDGLRPEIVAVTATGQAVITDLSGLLPLPLPNDARAGSSFYSAPELSVGDGNVDPRADLYGFGALLQALLLGRELTDGDFELSGGPTPYSERFPDAHPPLNRLLARTFVRNRDARFPSIDRVESDPTGFSELIEALRACATGLMIVRLDIAGCTNAGARRSGNEDAIGTIHQTACRLENRVELAVAILADGLGGMASGEVAAQMTVDTLRDYFLSHAPFVAGTTISAESSASTAPVDSSPGIAAIVEALTCANRAVFEVGQKEPAHTGMGCTAEVVVIDGRQVSIGHVGDCRTYLCRAGHLTQITHDQTLVGQLILLGQLSHEEAAHHPRRSELHQAVGGHREIYPDTHSLTLQAGDWLLICSDGLSDEIPPSKIINVLRDAESAARASRRLVNLAIGRGAWDNVSAIVIRAY
jgi:protein phosphatase